MSSSALPPLDFCEAASCGVAANALVELLLTPSCGGRERTALDDEGTAAWTGAADSAAAGADFAGQPAGSDLDWEL